MAQIVSTVVELGTTVALVGTANTLLRITVFYTAQKFGAWDPAWTDQWPRLPWRPLWRAWISGYLQRCNPATEMKI